MSTEIIQVNLDEEYLKLLIGALQDIVVSYKKRLNDFDNDIEVYKLQTKGMNKTLETLKSDKDYLAKEKVRLELEAIDLSKQIGDLQRDNDFLKGQAHVLELRMKNKRKQNNPLDRAIGMLEDNAKKEKSKKKV